jgi:hypothetical protein
MTASDKAYKNARKFRRELSLPAPRPAAPAGPPPRSGKETI